MAIAHKDNLPNALEQLHKGDHQVIERSIIGAVLTGTGEPVDTVNLALNETIVTHKNIASMVTTDTELNGDYLYSHWANGFVITTPTGSTDYSLSYAGPVILPITKNFVPIPAALHNLGVRPVIIPEDAEVRLNISGREKELLMSFDSYTKSIPNKQSTVVRKAPFVAKVICLEGDNLIKTLRTKLLWGENKRNK